MFKKQKYLVFILFLLLPFFSLLAAETDYPALPTAPSPTPEEGLPSYVHYIFNLALTIGGLVAFGVLIWGGVLYLTSAGNPEQIGNAKKKLLGAFLGLLILFAVYLILTIVNPDLVAFFSIIETNQGVRINQGICLYPTSAPHNSTCSEKNNFFITDTQKVLDLPPELENENSWQVVFYNTNQLVYVFSKEGFEGDWIRNSSKKLEETTEGEDSSSFNFFPKSVYFAKLNGVCLYDHTIDNLKEDLMHFPDHFVCLSKSTPNLGLVEPFFNDKAKAVAIYNDDGAVLFQDEAYKGKYAMMCASEEVIDVKNLDNEPSESSSTYCWGVEGLVSNNPAIGVDTVSSVEIWKDDKKKTLSGSVTFYNRPDCKGGSYTVSVPGIVAIDDSKVFSDGKRVFENIVSIKFNGTYAVILEDQPDGTGNAQLFKKPQGNDCIPSLVGSAIFDSAPESPDPNYQTKKVRRIIVVPARE